MLCASSETAVFMAPLGHNDAHCIVLRCKAPTVAGGPGLGTRRGPSEKEKRKKKKEGGREREKENEKKKKIE